MKTSTPRGETMPINNFFKKCTELPGVSIRNGSDFMEFNLEQSEGKGTLTSFSLFPGISLGYIFIYSPSWPAPNLTCDGPCEKGPLILNYCIAGRCELLLNTGSFIYLKEGELSLTERFAQSEYIYPQRLYEGIEIFIDTDTVFQEASYIKDVFHIDLNDLINRYCPDGTTYLGSSSADLTSAFHKIWALYNQDQSFAFCHMQTAVLELFSHLLHKQAPSKAKICDFFTSSQVEMAKKVQEIITSDLRQHHPVREIAEQFSVSETSIKKYFHGVFGQNISVYLRELRMTTAAKLLEEEKLSVSEIAENVGYMNQSKFASVFKKQFKMTPLEYRRRKNLEHHQSYIESQIKSH